jgi:hypothetical protein
MKLFAKIAFAVAVGGVGIGATIAAPDDAGTSMGLASDADAIKVRSKEDHQVVMRLKAAAYKEKDVIKLNCINDKLVQMLPEMNVLDSLVDQLKAASAADQPTVFKDVEASGNRVHEQRELAEQCADAKLIVTESSNTFTGPDIETPAPEWGFEPDIEPPGYASGDR